MMVISYRFLRPKPADLLQLDAFFHTYSIQLRQNGANYMAPLESDVCTTKE